MEKQDRFEDQWKDAFEHAELTPDKSVWSGIRAEMANQTADKYKRSAIYFRWLAAASVTILIGVVAASSYYYFNQEKQLVGDEGSITKNEISDQNNSNDQNIISNRSGNDDLANIWESSEIEKSQTDPEDLVDNKNQNIASVEIEDTGTKISNSYPENSASSIEEKTGLPVFNSHIEGNAISVVDNGENVEHVALFNHEKKPRLRDQLDPLGYSLLTGVPEDDVYLQMIPILDHLNLRKNKSHYKDLWAGLSFGGGNFDPNMSFDQPNVSSVAFEAQGLDAFSNTVANVQMEEQTPAFSIGLGFDVGTKLSPKIVLQSGITYQRYSSESISSFELQNTVSGQNDAFLLAADRSLESSQNVNYTSTYQVNNEFEYLSVPIEMGYLLVDRKFGFLLSSGMATDFFMKNTISDDSNLRNEVTVNNGDSSPYKSVNLNAIVGGELYYAFNDNYLVALEPSYKFSIDGITKSDANFLSKPHSLFVGFKFKYFIK